MLSIDVSKYLLDLRKGAGFTQLELSEILMTSRQTICRIEHNVQVPDAVTYLNWIHVCTNEPMVFVFEGGKGGMLQRA